MTAPGRQHDGHSDPRTAGRKAVYLAVLLLVWLGIALSVAVGSKPDDRLVNLFTALCLGVYRFYAVPEGSNRAIKRFGEVVRVDEPGLKRCLSFWNLYYRPDVTVTVREQAVEYETQRVNAKDQVQAEVDLVVYLRVCDVKKAVYAVENYQDAVKGAIRDAVRVECGNLNALELVAGRNQVAANVTARLRIEADPWGVEVRLVKITSLITKKN